jgi:hypothetical protein
VPRLANRRRAGAIDSYVRCVMVGLSGEDPPG